MLHMTFLSTLNHLTAMSGPTKVTFFGQESLIVNIHAWTSLQARFYYFFDWHMTQFSFVINLKYMSVVTKVAIMALESCLNELRHLFYVQNLPIYQDTIAIFHLGLVSL